MGECFITRRGGGSGKAYAAISVTYPTGSSCTCSNNSKTLTAKDTSGEWLFLVPSGGEWTITATDGTDTERKIVTVAYNDVLSISLDYGLYLIKNGVASDLLKPNASGFNSFYGAFRGEVDTTTYPGEYGVLATEIGGGNGAYFYVGTEQLIDLSEYKTLHAVVSRTSAWGWGSAPTGDTTIICVSTNKNLSNGITQYIATTLTSDTEYVLDVSSVTSGYVSLTAYDWHSAAQTKIYFKDLYLKK